MHKPYNVALEPDKAPVGPLRPPQTLYDLLNAVLGQRDVVCVGEDDGNGSFKRPPIFLIRDEATNRLDSVYELTDGVPVVDGTLR